MEGRVLLAQRKVLTRDWASGNYALGCGGVPSIGWWQPQVGTESEGFAVVNELDAVAVAVELASKNLANGRSRSSIGSTEG